MASCSLLGGYRSYDVMYSGDGYQSYGVMHSDECLPKLQE